MKILLSTEDENGYHIIELTREQREDLMKRRKILPCQSGECARGVYHIYSEATWAEILAILGKAVSE